MKTKEQIQEIKKKILPILKKNNIKKAGIFGSYARGEQKENSDIDILVEVQKGWSLLDLIGLELELKKLLRKEIDLLTYNGIHPLLKQSILNDEVRII
ncbi:nucleotidyltransferase family protein [Candidatus Pacearchaeota archaeon]|nr:nucleotidyltransferase family protein [Candidatus Pacearchaeota archaeon]